MNQISIKMRSAAYVKLLGLALACGSAAPSHGQWSNELSLESTAYWQDSAHNNSENSQWAAAWQPSWQGGLGDSSWQINFEGFARGSDLSQRNHLDIRELIAVKATDNWVYEVGIGKVFWGVTESKHLVDIINTVDSQEGIDGEDKLGQPMLKLTRQFEQNSVSAFVLPGHRKANFYTRPARFGVQLPTENATFYGTKAQYESDDESNHIDLALRWSGYLGAVDYGVSWFKGTARAASLQATADEPQVFMPYYSQIERLGIDLQYTRDAWLWKLEALHESATSSSYNAAVAGFEYTQYALFDGLLDLGWLAELQKDSRDDASRVLSQNDVFVGARWGFNDAQSSSLLVGAIQDLDDDSTSVRAEGSRRFGDDLTVSVEVQALTKIDAANALSGVANDDFVRVEVAYYF